jgi:8-oxo-dGTP diphosphatase
MTVVVVAAVVEQDHHFLVTRRQPGVHLAGMWEFPGGKIAPQESHDAALKREIREELEVDIEVGELAFETRHAYPDRTVVLYFYRCRLMGNPRPSLGQEMRWISRRDLSSLTFPPTDAELIARLVKSDAR